MRHFINASSLTTAKLGAIVVPLTLFGAIAAAQEADATEDGDVLVTKQETSEVPGDWMLGSRVRTTTMADIGKIEDLIIDLETGEVKAAVLSVGGFLGFGAKNIAVNWDRLNIDYDGNEITLDITREEAEEADEYVFRERETPPAPEVTTGAGAGATY